MCPAPEYRELINESLVKATHRYARKRLDREDAEDLAQDILGEALAALHEGRQITHFHAWYWGLAYKRYCLFLRKRGKIPPADTAEAYLLHDDAKSALERLVEQEDAALLNYGISRLPATHRQMVILYYLQNMTITEIAEQLRIPVGTVKRRLFDTKNILRKGLTGMNHTGKLAYAPAQFRPWGDQWAEHTHKILNNLILDQIFVACRDKPQSLNEISDEIGVAPVYLESIMQYPLQHGFLKAVGKGKYLTDFCVLPIAPFQEVFIAVGKVYENLGAEFTDVLLKQKDALLTLHFYGKDLPYDYLMWLLYAFACFPFATLCFRQIEKKWAGKVPPDNGKSYRIAATFQLPDEKLPDDPGAKRVGFGNKMVYMEHPVHGWVCIVNFCPFRIFPERYWLNPSNALLLFKMTEGNGQPETETEKEQAAFFLEKGVLTRERGRLRVNIPIMTQECEDALKKIMEPAMVPLAEKYADAVSRIADEKLLPYIREDLLEEYPHWIMRHFFDPAEYIYHWAMYEGKTLPMPEDLSTTAAGMYLRIEGRE